MDANDLREILALLANYGATLDEGRWEDHLELWNDTCVLRVFGRDFEGKSRIDRFMRGAHRGKHLTGVPRVAVTDKGATSVSDFVFFRAGEMTLNSAGSYRDELVRTSEGWRFAHREIEIQLRAE